MKWANIEKALGLNPDATIEDVRAAMTAQDVRDFKDGDGNVADLDAIYKNRNQKSVVIQDEADAADAEVVTKTAEAKAAKKAPPARLSDEDASQPAPISRKHAAARKAYQYRIQQGEAKFADADIAEQTAAFMRLAAFGKAYGGRHGYKQEANDLAIVGKTAVEFDNIAGGFLVPDEFVAQLIYLTEPTDIARKLANVVRMNRDVASYPRKTGFPAMTFVSENGVIPSSPDQTFDRVVLTAKKIGRILEASNELLDDSAINVADTIAESFREAYGNRIDQCYFNGDGTAPFGGIQGLTAALPAAAYINGAGNWAAFTSANFTTVLGSIQNINPNRIAMVCSREFYFQVMVRLERALNQFKPLLEGSMADAQFLGVPVYWSQAMATTTGANVRSCYIGDFMGGSMIGERRDLAILGSDQHAFDRDAYAWRATARFDVNIHGDGRGGTVGPIACLVATA